MWKWVAAGMFGVCVSLVSLAGMAQDQPAVEARPASSLITVNLAGPFIGIYTGSYETKISDRMSFYVSPLYMNLKMTLLGSLIPPNSHFWGLGAAAGLNFYFAKPLAGFFLGGGGSFTLFNIGDTSSNLTLMTLGVQAQVGYRWIFWGWLAIAPQLNVSYTFALAAYEGEVGGAVGLRTTPVLGFAIAF